MAAANGISDVPDFFSPYADQLRSSIEALRRHLSQVENDEIQYKALQDTLQTYPRSLTRTAVVRVGPRAIVRAQVNHTNEIYTSIGDGYVVQQSAFSAAEMAGRKLEFLQNGKKQIETQIEDLERKLSQIEVISQPDQLVLDEESGLPFMEIREELDEDGNVIGMSRCLMLPCSDDLRAIMANVQLL
ncbi:Prefoldin [Myxozyma melibiosi]|uniref:Prefoldin n=1 Tax=Myxozyma melibiosi TaxID=54550 RepID=A0ABR1F4M7_9ASCO